MTGERMETVREVLRLEEYPGTRAHYVAVQAALAEVERWERDRARLERQLAEAIAQDYCTICGAALGEGQDRDRPLVRCPVFGEARGTAGCEVCGGDIVNCPIYGP